MAMSVTYTTFNGQIVYENREGVESYYAPDTLGSTSMLVSQGGVVTDTFTYWPFGEILSHVGSGITPFTFEGTFGNAYDTAQGLTYSRARFYMPDLAMWLTLATEWPLASPYAAFRGEPTSYTEVVVGGGMNHPGCQGGNPKSPPRCPRGQTPVFITCYGPDGSEGGRCAQYCDPAYCKKNCPVNPTRYPGGPPSGGTPLCGNNSTPISIPGFGTCVVSNGGCGQQQSQKPVPDNWLDFPGCNENVKCWVCVTLPPTCGPGLIGPRQGPKC